MKIAVTGSRSIKDTDTVFMHLDKLIDGLVKDGWLGADEPVSIVSGGAKGVDTLAKEYANINGYDFFLYKPYHLVDNRTEYDPKYFFARNKQIVDNADYVFIFWDGQSHGTAHVMKLCDKTKKTYQLIRMDGTHETIKAGGTD